jgi:chlorite dismutase
MTETAARSPAAADAPAVGAPRRARPQYVSFRFHKLLPEWRRLSAATRAEQKAELLGVLDALDADTVVRAYSTVGTRGDADLLLWTISAELEGLGRVASAVATTALGGYLTTPHAFLAMTRRSQYVADHHHAGQDGRRTRVRPAGGKYLFVYPFVKTHAWYQLPFAERQRMMDEHIKVGHEFPSVKINTTYSFGLDDQEFVVAFETDEPADFLDLVMKLRSAEQRPYTERDTPIFTCLAMPIADVLESVTG